VTSVLAREPGGPDGSRRDRSQTGEQERVAGDRLRTHQDFGDKRPSELFGEHAVLCFISDGFGVENRHAVGVDNINWECDYTHSDTIWPRTPEILMDQFEGVPDAEIERIRTRVSGDPVRRRNLTPRRIMLVDGGGPSCGSILDRGRTTGSFPMEAGPPPERDDQSAMFSSSCPIRPHFALVLIA